METKLTTDVGQLSRNLGLPENQIQATVELLDDGNTVPFITRYRKDITGGLDEQQIRDVQLAISKLRLLTDRKQTILRSLESQKVLTEELSQLISDSNSIKRLEDLYLPHKPKKQSLAVQARQRGLEPLANEILSAHAAASDLQLRAADFVDAEKGLQSSTDVLLGVQHIIAEKISERADVRSRLRRILWRSGKIVSTRIEPVEPKVPTDSVVVVADSSPPEPTPNAESSVTDVPETPTPESPADVTPDESNIAEDSQTETVAASEQTEQPVSDPTTEQTSVETSDVSPAETDQTTVSPETASPETASPETVSPETVSPETVSPETVSPETAEEPKAETTTEAATVVVETPSTETPSAEAENTDAVAEASNDAGDAKAAAASAKKEKKKADAAAAATAKAQARIKRKAEAKARKKKQRDAAYKDYYDFNEAISKLPPHRVLALNRGERSRVLRVKLVADNDVMQKETESVVLGDGHEHADFLRECIRDAFVRLLVPSLDREVRRELSDKAEIHAVEVFAQNLRKLLLQPPVHETRVLAVDPGFRSGCKLAALDQFGNVLGHGIIHLVGSADRRKRSRRRMAEMIKLHNLSVIAIGNGTACREVEEMIGDLLSKDLKDADISYVIVNEAGASVYSTSQIGREELSGFDATLRSAISIGRRLLDPLSELVKITPAHIGVGLYQHDVKSKHLRESLDAVVESCVNFVGVDVNSASPALLRYVSGLNQLTARRLYEYRQQNGPFKNREQFKEVPGLGDATFTQAAGFLKIAGSENPLDATWIHPESYEVAEKVLDRIGCSLSDLTARLPVVVNAPPEPPVAASPVKQEAASTADDTKTESPAETPEAAKETDTTAVEAEATVDSEQASELKTETVEAATAEPDSGSESTSETPAVDSAPPTQENETAVAATPEVSPESENASEESSGDNKDTAAEGNVDPAASPETEVPAIATAAVNSIADAIAKTDSATLATDLGVGQLTLQDILDMLQRPGRDPREDLPAPIFRQEILKLDDLEPNMQLLGTVLNVVDFGVFVDIGLSDSGLIHISRLADRYVSDPHEVVSVGDIVKAWVVSVDKKRRRVSLTAIEPGTEKPASERGENRKRQATSDSQPAKRRSSGKPRSQGGPRGGQRKDRQRRTTTYKPKVVKKPVVPITDNMVKGDEPMRTFGDLKQFFDVKPDDGKPNKK